MRKIIAVILVLSLCLSSVLCVFSCSSVSDLSGKQLNTAKMALKEAKTVNLAPVATSKPSGKYKVAGILALPDGKIAPSGGMKVNIMLNGIAIQIKALQMKVNC